MIGNIIGGVLGAGGQIIGQAMSNKANRKNAENQKNWNLDQWNRQNTKNQQNWEQQNKYNEGQLTGQRAYEQKMWEQQNQYNSPIEQMARLKEAGLNPHLMYGKGTVGTSGTASGAGQQIKAGPVANQSVQGYTRAESRNVLQGIDAFRNIAQLKNLEANTSNTAQSTSNLEVDNILKIQQGALGLIGIDVAKLKYRGQKELFDTSVQATKTQLDKLTHETRIVAQNADIGKATKQTKINSAIGQLKAIGLNNKGTALKNSLLQWENDLSKLGLSKTDSKGWRMAASGLESLRKSVTHENWNIIKSTLKFMWYNSGK